MAIADVTIVPVGQESMSDEVARVHEVLDQYDDKVKYELTSMSTIIEGDLHDLFQIIEELHHVPFSNGANRVATNIRIDDRRDTVESIEGKKQAVRDKKHQ
ncbi:MTH1187 family thiamine-binding protein [Salsuginibacillus kocurii]|uniref:MTH1187 family thiamine-binding protein n=1 Tax=Salsuginibacillus kocurii TaxID=427078 RepID=UPI000366581D|nr:MTH1187 family thiamine-binding protein [Salsuginibacillus kocurii]